jgi:hypothetical protein
MSKLAIVGEFWTFMRQNKKCWLLPIVMVLLMWHFAGIRGRFGPGAMYFNLLAAEGH